MRCRMGAAVVAALGLWASPAWAQFSDVKTLRLGDVPTIKLGKAGPNADTELVRSYGGHHGGYHGGYRSNYYGGYRGYYGGYRGFYGGYHNYYRPYYAGFRPYYGGYGYRNFYYPRYSLYASLFGYGYGYGYGYRPYAYYAPPVYYYDPSCYYPTGLTTSTFSTYSPVMPLTSQYESGYVPQGTPVPQPGSAEDRGVPVPKPGSAEDGTFPYDGGPSSPVPMPKADPVPSRDPVRPAPKPEGRIVSLPAPTTPFAYSAYGEKTAPTSFAQDRPAVLKSDPVKAARR
jgi:hypothetical protein